MISRQGESGRRPFARASEAGDVCDVVQKCDELRVWDADKP